MVMKAAAKRKNKPTTLTVAAGEFKAKCLQLIDEVHEDAVDVIVTKRGKPMARLVPFEAPVEPFVSIVGRSPQVEILGDIISPLDWPDPVERWDRVHRSQDKRK